MPPISLLIRSALLLALLALPVGPAAAGGFAVNPLLLELVPEGNGKYGTLEITNTGDAPLTLQARPMLWQQDERGDFSLTPDRTLVLFPKILQLAPRQTVTLRAGFNGKTGQERFYRVLLTELLPVVPPMTPATADQPAKFQTGVRTRVEMSVPVIVTPAALRATPRRIALAAADIAGHRLQLQLRNDGDRVLRTNARLQARLYAADGSELGSAEANANYLLAGKRITQALAIDGVPCERIDRVDLAVLEPGREPVAAGSLAVGSRDCTPPGKPRPPLAPRAP